MSRKKRLFGAFAVGSVLVVLTGTAYACTAFRGVLTVTGTNGTSTAVGDNTTTHAWCTMAGGAQASAGDTVTVTVGAASVCQGPDGTNKLWPSNDSYDPAGVLTGKGVGSYDVRLANGAAFDVSGSTYTWTAGTGNITCFEGDAASSILLGSMTVDTSGNGTWTGALPSTLSTNSVTDASGICVGNPGHTAPALSDPQKYLEYNVLGGKGADEQTNMAPISII